MCAFTNNECQIIHPNAVIKRNAMDYHFISSVLHMWMIVRLVQWACFISPCPSIQCWKGIRASLCDTFSQKPKFNFLLWVFESKLFIRTSSSLTYCADFYNSPKDYLPIKRNPETNVVLKKKKKNDVLCTSVVFHVLPLILKDKKEAHRPDKWVKWAFSNRLKVSGSHCF